MLILYLCGASVKRCRGCNFFFFVYRTRQQQWHTADEKTIYNIACNTFIMRYCKSVMKNDKNILLHFGRLTNAERICLMMITIIIIVAYLPTYRGDSPPQDVQYNIILYIYHYFVRVAANVRSSIIFYYV